ncbi:MAG: hypothetical protein HQL44_13970 [Alphaproteobacteria bacterium]|nr:hypothetical protein [Alphaproteobacteria bacterium]
MTFLMNAELARAQSGLDDVFIVLVHPTTCQSDSSYFGAEERRWRVSNILLPMLAFFPRVSGFRQADSSAEAVGLHHEAEHVFPPPGMLGQMNIASMSQELVAGLVRKPPVAFPRADGAAVTLARQWLKMHVPSGLLPIVITLRDAGYSQIRNSNLETWAGFAQSLDRDKFCPVFVPDTQTAFQGPPKVLEDFPWFSSAAFHLGLRFAVYELAYLNLLTSNGPSALCYYSPDIRYLFFKIIVEDAPESTKRHLAAYGYDIGKNLPFAGPFQKWVWEDDDPGVVWREFEAMVASIERSC